MTPSSSSNFDPRAWNLFAGAALLAAGCGARVIGQDGDGTGSEGTDSGPPTDSGPECVVDSDCPTSHKCKSGVCDYYSYSDGWITYYECSDDSQCPLFEYCGDFGCEPSGIDRPPACDGEDMQMAIPIALDSQILGLTFADVDADGRAELVVATATQLQVFASGVALPTNTAHELAGPVTDMLGAELDDTPGDDVILLVEDAIEFHSSAGDGTFAAPVETPGLSGGLGLLVGDFNEQPPADVLVWGSDGGVVVGEQQASLALTDEPVVAAAAFEFGGPALGFGLRRPNDLDFYGFDGALLTSDSLPFSDSPFTAAAFNSGADARYLLTYSNSGWSRVDTRHAETGEFEDTWAISGVPRRILVADFDGDGADDLLYLHTVASPAIHYDPLGVGNCSRPLTPPLNQQFGQLAAVGDHDGDGDDDLAITNTIGGILIFDGG